MTFDYTDAIISYLDNQLIERYSRLKSLVSFDELNVLGEVNSLYQDIEAIIREAFTELARQVYAQTLCEIPLRSLDEEWIDALLNGYDPVSKYVFVHEFDRKRARLAEALIAGDVKQQEVDTALRAMSFMCRIYADRITDEAVMQAYIDDGEQYVRWVAEIDNRTCTVCEQRNGTIYPIYSVPADPHPNCRCRRERVQ